jgi:cytochrome P450
MMIDQLSALEVDDPCEVYARLRAETPVDWSDGMQCWVVSRYDDVRAVLQDNRFSARHSVQQLGAGPDVDLGLFARIPSLATTDPPLHTRLRRLVSRAFTPRSVDVMRAPAKAMVAEALDAAAERGRLDVVADVAASVPARIIGMMLGVATEDWPLFKRWSDDLFGAFKGDLATADELAAAAAAAHHLESYLRAELRGRRGDGAGDDLLIRLRDAEEDGQRLTEDEALTAAILLLVGGNETTTGLIVNGFNLLLAAPALCGALAADRSLVPAAVEEFLRLAGPVHHLSRVATERVELGGRVMERGHRVLLLTASADRDAAKFARPAQADLERGSNEHVAFGRGRHVCLGAPLARLEASVIFDCYFERFSSVRAIVGWSPRWVGPFIARRVDELTLDLSPST